jgi:Putative transposase
VLAYLSRYTHRVAISNSRLISCDDAGVTFKWKDYRAKGCEHRKIMTLATNEFIRRFLIHVLPSGFHRIRHYGLFANGSRADNLRRLRDLINAPVAVDAQLHHDTEPHTLSHPCPCCGGRMIIIETFEPGCSPRTHPARPIRIDSS